MLYIEPAFLTQLVGLLYDRGAQLVPNHCKRDHNQWAHDLTHPDPVIFTHDSRLLRAGLELFAANPTGWADPCSLHQPEAAKRWDSTFPPSQDPSRKSGGAAVFLTCGVNL